jgi:hypothetical protein
LLDLDIIAETSKKCPEQSYEGKCEKYINYEWPVFIEKVTDIVRDVHFVQSGRETRRCYDLVPSWEI